jgi:hypothetical protein
MTEAPGRVQLRRIGGFDAVADRPLSAPVALEIESPCAWLDELRGRGGFACADAAVDRRLLALREGYLAVRRVGAVLQASLGANARACGLVGCEQTGSARAWTRRDAVQLKRFADAISLRGYRRLGSLPA